MRALQGKAIVVTGAARGLGAAYGLYFAREGASVVVNDIDADACQAAAESIASDPQVADAGGTAIAKSGDIADFATAGTLVGACVERFGKLDGLVNNAGIFHLADPDEESEEGFRRMIEVNVLGAAWCGLHALRCMKRQRRGSLVNVSSGAVAGLEARAAYGASKGALTSMTYAWAVDMRPFGVRVNAVSPLAGTAMSDQVDDYFRRKGRSVSRGVGDPTANAPLAAFLLSDFSSSVTGQFLRTQGGELSLMSPAAILLPSLRHEHWTVEDVRDAFVNEFAGRLFPPGLVPIETRPK